MYFTEIFTHGNQYLELHEIIYFTGLYIIDTDRFQYRVIVIL